MVVVVSFFSIISIMRPGVPLASGVKVLGILAGPGFSRSDKGDDIPFQLVRWLPGAWLLGSERRTSRARGPKWRAELPDAQDELMMMMMMMMMMVPGASAPWPLGVASAAGRATADVWSPPWPFADAPATVPP